MNLKKLSILFLILINTVAYGCTTGLVSARITSNNRPLLWKNRDSGHEYNAIKLFDYGNTQILGIINSGDTTQIWAGVNSYGFAIINAEARDMARENEDTRYDDEGILMKQALKECQSMQDFEKMLQASNDSGRAVTSNFGVMDVQGEIAYYETGNHEYFKFSANDLFTNPEGYIVRSNFAVQGNRKTRYGLERYLKAFHLFEKAKCQEELDCYYILRELSPNVSFSNDSTNYKNIYKSINRKSSVSAAIFEGIREGEDPELTTFWCNIGEPALSVAVPLWVYSGQVPNVLNTNDSSAINHLSLELETFVYPDTSKINSIYYPNYKEIDKEIAKIQNYVIKRAKKTLSKWRTNKPTRSEVAEFQNKLANHAYKKLKQLVKRLPGE